MEDIRSEMTKKDASALVVTALDEVACKRAMRVSRTHAHTRNIHKHTHTGLYNLRGSDVSYNPVFFSYAIVTLTDVRLFIDDAHLTTEVTQHLSLGAKDGVQTFPYSAISTHISEILRDQDGKVWVDSHSSQALCALVPKTRRVRDLSPIQLLKGVKNTTEIEGMKSAHVSRQLIKQQVSVDHIVVYSTYHRFEMEQQCVSTWPGSRKR